MRQEVRSYRGNQDHAGDLVESAHEESFQTKATLEVSVGQLNKARRGVDIGLVLVRSA